MNMRSIATATFVGTFSDLNISDFHKITGSQSVEIGSLCSDISTRRGNSVDFYNSFFVETKRPKKGEKIICTWVTIDEDLWYLRSVCIYHTSRILYFFTICKDLSVLFS
jgi:hypothetical protein